jgi:uncharacterized protein (DUF58 family)
LKDYRKYLKPDVIAKVKGLELKARLVVEGFVAGFHKSPYHGFSVEFIEHRPYVPGDEVRYVDWKVYGKRDRLYIKEYEEETNLRCFVLLDASNSMSFGSRGLSKFEYGACLASAISFLLLQQRDYVGFVLFSDGIREYIPSRGNPGHLNFILQEIAKTSPSGKTDLSHSFRLFAERIKRRGLIVVISDLFDERTRVLQSLKQLRHKKHEVIVFHLMDEAELSLSFKQPVLLEDLEDGSQIQVDPRVIRKRYLEKIHEFLEDYRIQCRSHMIDYILVNTSTPFDQVLINYLGRRRVKI